MGQAARKRFFAYLRSADAAFYFISESSEGGGNSVPASVLLSSNSFMRRRGQYSTAAFCGLSGLSRHDSLRVGPFPGKGYRAS
jgi:hypothetical protein